MRKVSIIIPVVRPKVVSTCIDAIMKNAGVPSDQYEIITDTDLDYIGCPKMVKKLTAMAAHDLIMFLGDDTEPEADFLKNALVAMDKLPDGWGVVGLNTEDKKSINGNPLAHWLADRRMLDLISGGDFFPTEYRHCWCDDELHDIAEENGRWIYAPDAQIKHNHPVNKTADYDEHLQRAYTDENWWHDRRVYLARKRARTAEKGRRIALCLPLTDQMIYSQFFFSFVNVLMDYVTAQTNRGLSANVDVLLPDFPGQVDAVRNNLVNQALELGCTHILMMDTDQIYNTPDMIEQLLAHNRLVVGARVHRRYPPFDPLMLRGSEGSLESLHDDEIMTDDGEFRWEVQVDYTGAGCVMYESTVFIDMMPKQWFKFKTGDHGQPVGEDIAFCTELKEAGIPIIVDASIDVKHLTLLATDWGTHKLFEKLYKPAQQQEKQNGK